MVEMKKRMEHWWNLLTGVNGSTVEKGRRRRPRRRPPSHVVCHCEFSPLEQIILILGFAILNDNQNSVLFSINTGLMFSYKDISCLSQVGDTVFTLLVSAFISSALLLTV